MEQLPGEVLNLLLKPQLLTINILIHQLIIAAVRMVREELVALVMEQMFSMESRHVLQPITIPVGPNPRVT